MINRLTIIHIIIVLMMMISCDDERLNFDKAIIPLKPVNFTQVNTEYDDYNSDLSRIWSNERLSLIFSTNRDSKGNDFDFILYDCDISVNLVDGKFTINVELESDSLIELINSSYNELGPFITNDIVNYYSGDMAYKVNRFFYASDKNGSLDSYVNYYTIDSDGLNAEGNTIELNGINTSYDEGYLTIHKNSNSNREKIFFTSNRDNKFDIYRALSEENKLIDQSESIEVEKNNRNIIKRHI